ncbi:rhomboid family intramembrane serine protease [Synechococcus moorigangaii CMS01]|nr:rhomboid family intramembrane serine protease [Synechococcus moorigangaii CMS01]
MVSLSLASVIPFALWPLIWFYGISFSCGALMLRTWRSPQPRSLGWLWVAAFVLALTWGLNLISMAWAALGGGLAWGLLLLVPSLGFRRLQSLLSRQHYQQAYQWAVYLRYLHPFDGWWEQPNIIRALILSQRGQHSQGRLLLEKYQDHPSFLARQAIAMHYAMGFDWGGLLTWLRQLSPTPAEPLLLVYYGRALGETGQLLELLQFVTEARTKRQLLRHGDRHQWYLVLLFTAAFCGEIKTVQRLLSGGLHRYPQAIKTFWLAIAHYSAGQSTRGRVMLQTLQTVPESHFQNAVQVRLKRPPKSAQLLLPREAYPLLAQLTRLVHQEGQEQGYQSLVGQRSTAQAGLSVNRALIAVNCLVFLGAIALGFAGNPEVLIQGGGFIPNQVLRGEWWRFFTANFIHVGLAHLVLNMVTLGLLGPFAEKHLGRSRYLIVYLGSGFGAMITLFGLVLLAQGFNYEAFPTWLAYLTSEIRYGYQVWVGASGSIMGMIGAIAVVLWQGWRRLHIEAAGRQFRLICLIILIQFAVDLSSPNVSFYSHWLGLCWGILLTSWLSSSRTQTK